jgi:hypothetical protein
VSYWKTKPAVEQARQLLEPLVAFIGRGEDEPPVRPWTFKIVDEHGVEREVYAPPGRVMRWRW